MIVDFHTHIFPPSVRSEREEYLKRDPSFAALYAGQMARLASAEELLAAMDAAGVDASVVTGFAWSEHEMCLRSNDYLLEAAAKSGGRLIPFCAVQPLAGEAALKEVERCLAGGALGIGELRPQGQGYSIVQGEAAGLLAFAARRYRLVLLFHVSEPVGHSYPGKEGLPLTDFYSFVHENPDINVAGAHLGGGLPFYSFMPEVAALTGVYFDTAAVPYLYRPETYRHLLQLIGPERLLFASDFPLISPIRQKDSILAAGLGAEASSLILGGNARRLLGLKDA